MAEPDAALTPDERLIARAKACFIQGTTASQHQRAREQKALRFYADDQWDPAVKRAREGTGDSQSGLPPLPPRPTITINKVKDPVRQVVNQEREAELGVEIVAADDFEALSPAIADPEIELREGLVRRIQRQSDAAAARSWAFQRAVIAGTGWYRVLTRFLPGKTFDQEVYVARIYDQASVIADPAHEEPDGSDAEWMIVGTDVPWERYRSEYPTAADGQANAILDYDDDDFRALGAGTPEWFTTDESRLRMCRVIEYYYTERTSVTLCELPDGAVVEASQIPDGVTVDDAHRRTEVTKQIKWVKLDGHQILDRTDWPGPDMPFIKVLCEELQPYDAERRAQGIVEPAMGAQEGFNAVASKFLETYALAPPPVPQGTPEQIEPFKQWYQARTTRHLPYLPYHPAVVAGTVLPAPSILNTEIGATIQALTMGLQMFSESVATTTGVDSQLAHLGGTDPALKSGKAIQALQAQSAQSTSGPLSNLKRSVSYEGHITNNLLYPIYGRKPGRLVRIVNGQGESERLQIGAAGLAPEAGVQAKAYTLTPDAKFNVIIKIAPKVTARRQQEAATLGEIISAQPQMMGVFGDLFFKYQDGPGHQEMSERAKAMLVPQVQQILAQHGGETPIPAAAQAQIQQLQHRLQTIEGIAQQAAQELQSHQLEQATKLKQTELEIASKERLAAADRETKLAIAELSTQAKDAQLFLEERARLGLQADAQAFQAHQADLDRQHEAALVIHKSDLDREKLKGRKKTVVTKTLNRGADGALIGATESHEELDEPTE